MLLLFLEVVGSLEYDTPFWSNEGKNPPWTGTLVEAGIEARVYFCILPDRGVVLKMSLV